MVSPTAHDGSCFVNYHRKLETHVKKKHENGWQIVCET